MVRPSSVNYSILGGVGVCVAWAILDPHPILTPVQWGVSGFFVGFLITLALFVTAGE